MPQVQPVAPLPQPSASGPHGWQAVDDFRQLLTVVGMHWPLLPPRQQPVGQEAALQLQDEVAPLQLWPAEQLGAVPHRQAPADEQVLARWAPQTLQAAVAVSRQR